MVSIVLVFNMSWERDPFHRFVEISRSPVARRGFSDRLEWEPAPLREAARARPGGLEMPLYRSRRHKLIAGVCGGIADFLGWDPTLVRIGYVVVSVASAAFPGLLAYVVLWIVMPREPAISSTASAVEDLR
jgi:phage shock protein C